VRRRPRRPWRPTHDLAPGLWHRLRRHPLAYWGLVAALALTTGAVVAGTTDDARRTANAWGDRERVAVARHAIEPGDLIHGDDIDWRDLPRVALPHHPATEVVGRVATAPFFAGEMLVAERLAPDGSCAVAAQVPSGRRAMAVPSTRGAPPLEVGDVVDLVAVVDPAASGIGPARVASAASVVAIGDEAVTVAVEVDEVGDTAFAISTGAVIIALAGSR
jgi:Flp pilus assembly protein CpaB